MCVKIVSVLCHEIGVKVKDWSVIKMGVLFNQFVFVSVIVLEFSFLFVFG